MTDFYLDHNVAVEVADLLNEFGHDAITAVDVGAAYARDQEHLSFAARQRRVLVTQNKKDFLLLHEAWRDWSSDWGVAATHAGILIIPQTRRVPRLVVAREISVFVNTSPPLDGELYEWRVDTGWLCRT